MKKNTGLFGSLQKSTKVTLLSCISFIALTLLILIFFLLFPITPSERIMASIGRENMYNNNPQNVKSVVTAAVTTANNDIFEEETGTRTTKTYKIVITTGSGFLWNGRIPDGISDTKTTVVIHDEPSYPTADPGYSYPIYTQPSVSEPEPPATDVTPIDPVEPPVDPNVPPVTDIPNPVDPIDPNIPPATDTPVPVDPVIPDPPQTQPPIIIDPYPPVDNPGWSDPNGTEYGDDVSEW